MKKTFILILITLCWASLLQAQVYTPTPTVSAPGATVTITYYDGSWYDYDLGYTPISSVTINAGDSVVWNVNNNYPWAPSQIYCMDSPSSCQRTLYSFPATQAFLYDGSYSASCNGECNPITIFVNPVAPINPPSVWDVTGVCFLSSGTYNLYSLHIHPGGTIYLTGSVNINVSGNIIIDSGSYISGIGMGYSGCEGYFQVSGQGPGSGSATQEAGSGSGGGHGGGGGNGFYEADENYYSIPGGGTYDTPSNPSQPGSGGGMRLWRLRRERWRSHDPHGLIRIHHRQRGFGCQRCQPTDGRKRL